MWQCNPCDFRISSRAMRKWIVATLVIALAAGAQKTHNQYESPNAPGAGQKLLAQFAGNWDVIKTFFPMNGKPIVTRGECKQYMIQDGRFLESDFYFRRFWRNEEYRHGKFRLRFQDESFHHSMV